MVHWSFILGQGWLLSNHSFVKHVKTVFIQVVHVNEGTQCSVDALIVALLILLWKLPNAIMQRKQRQRG